MVGELAVSAGATAAGVAIGTLGLGFAGAAAVGIGAAVVVGAAGAIGLYYLGKGLDCAWGKFKDWLF